MMRSCLSIAWLRPLALAVVLAAALAAVAAPARADLPGTIPLAASGDGHLWWVVRSEPVDEKTRGVATTAGSVTFALMHHAADEPAPSERMVMRFPLEPLAIASEGTRVVVVTRSESAARGFIVSMFAARNEAVGHWFTMPRGAPVVLPALPVEGELRGLAVAKDTLAALVRIRRADPRAPERFWFGTAPCESGPNAGWTESPLPDIDLSERASLFARGGGFAILGARGGAPVLASLRDGAWSNDAIRREDGAASAPSPTSARAVIGAFEVAQRTAVVERSIVDGGGNRIRVGFLRDRAVQPWAEFAEPVRPWSIGSFGTQAIMLELGERSRGIARSLPFSSDAPTEPVELSPPGFASGSWIHLPIIGVLSVALVLAAIIFGSEAYLERRGVVTVAGAAGAPASARTVRGATLSARSTAILIDMLPGLVAFWFLFRGNPLDLLRIPAFQTDLAASVPALFVFATGWFAASFGDVLFGRSMGKRIVGLRIISVRGGDAPVGRRIVRSLASAIVMASPLVMLIALLNPRGDGPAEMISGTAVVDEDELRGERPTPPADDEA